jgi:hypothetical protein
MKARALFLSAVLAFLAACASPGSSQLLVSELPDPAIYGLKLSELPEVGLAWQQSYNQTTTEQGYKWSYLAYQAYQPGSMGVDLASAFAVNNDVVLYDVDMSRADLPQPPQAMGNIQNISWKSTNLGHNLGDKSAAWKTTLGEMLTPIWWLEFYQGHAYVRISLLGFPDQVAPSILYGLGDLIVNRLPRSTAALRTDALTVIATLPDSSPPSAIASTPIAAVTPAYPTPPDSSSLEMIPVLGYTAPPGETGMVSFFDDTGRQLADGIFGSNDILQDLGSGTAYEWVGWTEQADPITLAFSLGEQATIAGVHIGFNHRDGLGIFVPQSVTINGTVFPLDADAVPNNQRADLAFVGPFQGPAITIELQHRGRGWVMIDEVTFFAGQ